MPVFDADAEVHRLYEGEAVPAIAAAFPKAVRGGKVDRTLLAQEVAGSPEKLKALESIVHPMVVKAEIDFLREQEKRGAETRRARNPAPVRDGRRLPRRRDGRGQRAGGSAEGPRARASRHDRSETCWVCSSANSRIAKNAPAPTSLWTRDTSLADMHAQIDKLIESLEGPRRPRHGAASSRTNDLREPGALREVVLDTETTGLDPASGHRIVEIGCVELINCIPTGRVWHCHLNPERDMPQAAYEVHGLSTEFLSHQAALP